MNDNNLRKAILNLESMLDYQEGSVVSRTLVNKDVGTVTLFSFDKGEGLSEHTAPFDALVYVVEGEAEIIISKEKFLLKKGQMIIMPADEPHALNAPEKFKMMLIMIKS
ncbi:MAG: cupin domain-containing protein, partial [Candidatus Lokiarchaeota archaeon]|nr:cupin domain-containing protein [Candidatus Lokiarchaeota archaeon]